MNSQTEHTRTGHEPEQLSIRPVVTIIGGIFLGLVLLAGVSLAVWQGLFGHADSKVPPAPQAIPPQPRLQAHPLPDRSRYDADKQARLSGYAWEDRDRAVARIPVSAAMQALVEREQDSGEAAR